MAATRKPSPVAADALGEAIAFPFEGATYTIPAPSVWPLAALEAFEDGKVVALLKALLGPVQYAAFSAKEGRTVADAQALVEAMVNASGISGN